MSATRLTCWRRARYESSGPSGTTSAGTVARPVSSRDSTVLVRSDATGGSASIAALGPTAPWAAAAGPRRSFMTRSRIEMMPTRSPLATTGMCR